MDFLYKIDQDIFLALNGLAGVSEIIDLIIIFLAEYLAYILPVVFLYLVFRSKYSIKKKSQIIWATTFAALFAKFGITDVIQYLHQRARPFVEYDLTPLFVENSFSFPSAHSAFFFAFSFSIFLYNKKWGIFFITLTVLMTISRMIAGVHYPSDIIGGMLVGFVVAYILYRIVKKQIKTND